MRTGYLLGSSLSTCKKLINDGWIGKPLYVNANMMSAGVETWHPRPEAFYEEGGGPLYDMAPYYLSALVKLLDLSGKCTQMRRKDLLKEQCIPVNGLVAKFR